MTRTTSGTGWMGGGYAGPWGHPKGYCGWQLCCWGKPGDRLPRLAPHKKMKSVGEKAKSNRVAIREAVESVEQGVFR